MEIPIVFITDNGYVLPTAVAITSLIANKKGETVYKIHIIVSKDVSFENRKKLTTFTGNNVSVEMMVYSADHIQNQFGYGHITNTCLLKFDVSELFPQYDKIIYLDGDILVKKDLTEFYNTPIEDCYLAAISDALLVLTMGYFRNLKLDNYFNAGVLLLNSKLIRGKKLKDVLYYERRNPEYRYVDQDIWNVVCKDNVYWLPVKYNNMISNCIAGSLSLPDINNYYNETYRSINSMILNSHIIHLCGPKKPWKHKKAFMGKEWMRYFRKSPFRTQKLNLISLENTVSLKRFLKRIIKNIPILKQLIGRYLEIRNVLYENNAILKELQRKMNNEKPLGIHSGVKKYRRRW